MKKTISRILGVGLSLAVLASLMVGASPVAAGTLSVSDEDDIPTQAVKNDVLAPPDFDILDMAVNEDTVYVVGNNGTDNFTYKSTDGGVNWTNLTTTTDYPEDKSPMLVAVAPDDPDVVIIATTDHYLYYSSDGGGDWTELGKPATTATVNAIDVSPLTGGYSYVAAAGTDGTDAELYTMKLAMAEPWKARAGYSGFATGQDLIAAVAFSPNYNIDKCITVISGNATSTLFQCYRYEAGAETWNAQISYFASDWGTGISMGAITSTLLSASIALPPSFDATDEGERIVFAGIATANEGGVVRITDTYVKHFETWSAGVEGPIHSVAYHEAGKLVAGGYSTTNNEVYSCLTPMDTDPRFERLNRYKQPGGESKVLVAWSGDDVFAATSGDESAFAVSTDDGYSFNDISLIDTELDIMADVAANADGSKVYLTSHDTSEGSGNYDTSVWIKDEAWTRVLSMKNVANANAPYLVRIAPDDDDVVYVSSKGSQDMYVSLDAGKGKWKHIPCYKLDEVVDFEVESTDVVHAIDATGYSKSTNTGASWSTEEPLDGMANAQTISLAPNNDILVGGMGDVAFSKDGGSSFTRILDTTDNAPVHIVADKDYVDNNMVYIAAGDEVERGELGKTEEWSSRESDDMATQVCGIARYGSAVYVMTYNATATYIWRALNLKEGDTAYLCQWGYLWTDDWCNANTPRALKISPDYRTDRPLFWMIGPPNELVSMNDPIVVKGATPKTPADEAAIEVNPVTGRAFDITFNWDRYSHKNIEEMEINIATDENFDAIVFDGTVTNITRDSVAYVVGPHGVGVSEFMPGQTYYWRVRVSNTAKGPLLSPWTETRSFTVEGVTTFTVTSPTVGASGVSLTPTLTWTTYEGAVGYEIQLAEDDTFAILDFSHTVDKAFYQVTAGEALAYSTTYYWRVRAVTGPPVLDAAGRIRSVPVGEWTDGVFTTMAMPVEPEPPVVIEPYEPPTIVVEPEVIVPETTQVIPPYLLWTIIGIGAVLVIALVILIIRTRRVA
jgi:photosystem II stability/assembly factor-like uncharacterized protein